MGYSRCFAAVLIVNPLHCICFTKPGNNVRKFGIGFFGVSFWSRDFFGVLFLSPFDHSRHLRSVVPRLGFTASARLLNFVTFKNVLQQPRLFSLLRRLRKRGTLGKTTRRGRCLVTKQSKSTKKYNNKSFLQMRNSTTIRTIFKKNRKRCRSTFIVCCRM